MHFTYEYFCWGFAFWIYATPTNINYREFYLRKRAVTILIHLYKVSNCKAIDITIFHIEMPVGFQILSSSHDVNFYIRSVHALLSGLTSRVAYLSCLSNISVKLQKWFGNVLRNRTIVSHIDLNAFKQPRRSGYVCQLIFSGNYTVKYSKLLWCVTHFASMSRGINVLHLHVYLN